MRIQAAEVRSTSKTDRLRNYIRTEPGIFSLNGNIEEREEMEAKSSQNGREAVTSTVPGKKKR